MKATFLYTLRRLRGSLLGWGLSLLVLAFLMGNTYSMVQQQAEEIEALLENMPGMLGLFGSESFLSPQSYLHVRFFSLMPIVLGIFAAAAGSGLLVQDEESGRLDLLLAHPISRRGLFFARLAALLVIIMGILALGWVGLTIGMVSISMDLSPLTVLWAFLSLLSIVVFTAALALLLSMVLPARRHAGMAAGLTIVASFFLTGFARLDESLEPLAKMLPLYYYQGGEAMDDFDPLRFFGLTAAGLLCIGGAYWRFERRDIRVAGEGMFPWKRFALGAVAVLAVCGAIVAASMGPASYDSPQQVMDAAATALEKEDWETFVNCLTPTAKEEWTAAMVVVGSAMELKGRDLAPKELLRSVESSSMEQMQIVFAMFGKFKAAMKHVDKDRLKQHASSIKWTMIASLATGDLAINEQHRKLAGLVDDADVFLVKALRAWSSAYQFAGLELRDVRIDSDNASGTLMLPGGDSRSIRSRKRTATGGSACPS